MADTSSIDREIESLNAQLEQAREQEKYLEGRLADAKEYKANPPAPEAPQE